MTLQEFMKNRPHNECVPIEQAAMEYIEQLEEVSIDRLNKLNQKTEPVNFDDNLFVLKEDLQSTTDYEDSQTNLKLNLEVITSGKNLNQINSFYQDVINYIESYNFFKQRLIKGLPTRVFEFKDRN